MWRIKQDQNPNPSTTSFSLPLRRPKAKPSGASTRRSVFHAKMKKLTLVACLIAGFVFSTSAGIRQGSIVHIKEDSVWFTSKAELISWIRTNHLYQQELLNNRTAWQFTARLRGRILQYWPQDHVVEFLMIHDGPSADHRFDGPIHWFVEDKAFE